MIKFHYSFNLTGHAISATANLKQTDNVGIKMGALLALKEALDATLPDDRPLTEIDERVLRSVGLGND